MSAVAFATASATGFLLIVKMWDELVDLFDELWVGKLFLSAGVEPEDVSALLAVLKQHEMDRRLYD